MCRHRPEPPRSTRRSSGAPADSGLAEPSVVATMLAALLTGAVSLTVGHPSVALVLHVPLFWLIGWSAAQALPPRWAAALCVTSIPLVVLELVALRIA